MVRENLSPIPLKANVHEPDVKGFKSFAAQPKRGGRPPSALLVLLLFISAAIYSPPIRRACSGDQDSYVAILDPSRVEWIQTDGPPGGRISQLVQSPYHHDVLYAITGNRLYESGDKGESWHLFDDLANVYVESVAPYGDKLFICGDGVYYHDDQGHLVKVSDEWFDRVTVSDGKLFVSASRGTIEDVHRYGREILYTDLSSGSFDWVDITPPESALSYLIPPPEGLPYRVRPSNILAFGNRVLVNIVLEVTGSGLFTNGRLYSSEDLGRSWAVIDLDMPEHVVINNIIQDRNAPDHLMLALGHNMMHEYKSPLSRMLLESYDGGRAWSPVTDLTIEVNAVTDVATVGSTYYLLCPYDGCMIELRGSDYERREMPMVEGFEGITFPLDALLFDLDGPQVVYGKTGTTWAYGLIKSEDGMETWGKMDEGIVASSPSIVLCHPQDPNVIFTSGNVIQEKYLTRDGGRTWEPFSPSAAGDELKVDPHDPSHMLLITEMSDIYESYDSGRTFQMINDGFWGAKVFDIAAAADGSRIYASTIGVGISELSPPERDWRHLTGSPDYAYRLEVDPLDSDVLYATCSPKIFENHSSIWRYSRDQEDNFGWSEIFRINDSRGITSLAFDVSNPDRIYAGVVGREGTIYASYDGGRTWRRLNDQLTFTTIWGHSQLQIDPLDEDIVYAGTWGGGTYRTADGGEDWALLDMNHTFSPTWLAISQGSPNIIYACDRTEAKIHRSNDSGKSWYTYYDFGEDYMLSSVVVIDPRDPDAVYASAFKPPLAHQGAFLKIEDGRVVADLSSGLPRSVIEMEIDPRDADVLYVATHMYGVFKSIDGGATWQRLDDVGTGLPRTGIYDMDVDPQNSSILYATAIGGMLPDYMLPPGAQNLEGKCGVYKSGDGGGHWSLILETRSEARGIDIDADDPHNLYVADMMGGVWVSNDGGLNWRQENGGLGSLSMTSVKVKDGRIYASTQGSGVYSGIINADGSIAWDASRSNKPRAEVFRIQIEVDPKNPERIYASAYPGGLLRSDDGGVHWNDKNFLTPSIRVQDPAIQGYYSFAIDPSNPNTVWMGVYGKGMYVSYDAMDSDIIVNGLDNEMRGKRITKVVVNPADPNEVYASSEEGVFVTRDGGRHWEGMSDGSRTLDVRALKVAGLVFPPFEDGFDDGGADRWVLEDGWSVNRDGGNYVLQGMGHKWASAGSESWGDYTFETGLKVDAGAVHVNFRKCPEGRYFLGFHEGGLYLVKQFNGWSEFANLVDRPDSHELGRWYELKVEVREGDIKIYVDGALKIEYSDPQPLLKGSIAFESLDDSDVRVDDVRVHISPTAVIYAGTAGYGVYELDAGNGRWSNLGRTLGTGWWSAWERRMYQFSSILFDPLIPGRIYLGHFPGGFFVSEDDGHTWRDSSLGLGNDGIFSLTMHPHDRDVMWAGTYNGASKSVDGGRTWEIKSVGMPSQQWPFCIAIDEDDPNVMYASTKNGQNKGLAYRNTFYGVVMKSTDGGESWFQIMGGLDNRSEFYKVIIHPSHHNILFLSSSNGVYVSNDAGLSWHIIANGLATTYNQARDNVADNLALTPDGKYLLLGLSGYGLWKADVSGAIVLNGIPDASFTYSPTEPTVLDAIVFADSSSDPDGAVVSWHWEFGDGGSSAEREPSHKFAGSGNYTVTLTVSDNYGSKDTFATILAVVNLPPTAGFTSSPAQPVEGDEVEFTDVSEDPEGHLAYWRWDFGDGNTSSEQNPSHAYPEAGDYTVTLTVADDEGQADSISMDLSVKTIPAFMETPLGMGTVVGIVGAILLVALIVIRKKR